MGGQHPSHAPTNFDTGQNKNENEKENRNKMQY